MWPWEVDVYSQWVKSVASLRKLSKSINHILNFVVLDRAYLCRTGPLEAILASWLPFLFNPRTPLPKPENLNSKP